MLDNDNHANSTPGGVPDTPKELALRKALMSIYGLSGDPETDARRFQAAQAYTERVAPRDWRRVVAAGRDGMELLRQRLPGLLAIQRPTRNTSLIAAGVVVGVTVLVTAIALHRVEGDLGHKEDGIVWRGAAGPHRRRASIGSSMAPAKITPSRPHTATSPHAPTVSSPWTRARR